MVKTPQMGTASPTAGFVVDGRVALPARVTETVELNVNPVGKVSEIFKLLAELLFAAFATTIAYVAVVPAAVFVSVGVLVDLVVVRTGTHWAPELAPGTSVARIERTAPVEPAVAPYESSTVVVTPLAPPVTFVLADPLIAMKPPPPPPPGPCLSPGVPPGT